MASNLPTKNGEADRDNLQIDHALTDDALSSSLLSSLQATAKTEALKLNKIVNDSTVEQTADFITITSLQLFPLALRLTLPSNTEEATSQYDARFMTLMQILITAFAEGRTQSARMFQDNLYAHLGKADPLLNVAFKELINHWYSDKVAVEMLKEKEAEDEHRKQRELYKARRVLSKSVTSKSASFRSTSAAQTKTDKPSAPEAAKPDTSVTLQQQPGESDDYGLDTADGVLMGRPPKFPAALLDWDNGDWDDKEDLDDMEEIITRRRARIISKTADEKVKDGAEPDGSEPEDDWVLM